MIEKTVFVTDDGNMYDDYNEAYKHEMHAIISEAVFLNDKGDVVDAADPDESALICYAYAETAKGRAAIRRVAEDGGWLSGSVRELIDKADQGNHPVCLMFDDDTNSFVDVEDAIKKIRYQYTHLVQTRSKMR